MADDESSEASVPDEDPPDPPDQPDGQEEPKDQPAEHDTEKPAERTEESDFRERETWLKDQERGQYTPDFSALLQQAITELAGHRETFGHSGVYIAGDVYNTGRIVGGDASGESGRAYLGEVVVGEVSAEVLTRIRRSFVRPPSYHRLQAKLRQQAVVLLEAPSGWGRTTTGLCVLDELCPDGVRKLSPDTDLRRLDVRKELKQSGGYLLEVRAMDQLTGLKVPHLEELSEACVDVGVRLVITIDQDIPLDGGVRTDYRVAGGDRPDLDSVLRSHLLVGLGERAAEPEPEPDSGPVAQLLADPKVSDVLATVLEDTLSMRRLVELADKLSMVALKSLDVEEIRAYFGEQSEEDFSQWFEELQDSRERAFVIALAVLNGMSYFTVARAAGYLDRRIREVENGDEDPGRPVFGVRRHERVVRARAELVSATDHTYYGPARVEAVRFRNDGYPRRVLEWAWREYDELRPLLLNWLFALGRDGDQAVRIRAAAAVGLLATFDFDRIRRDILLPWADNRDHRARESAVSALCVPSSLHPELAVHVIRMVHDWTRRRNRLNRQWTAARALGTSIGQSIRPQAIKLLARAAGRDSLALSFAVGDSMLELFVAPEENAQRDVLKALKRWTSGTASSPRQETGVICFLRLAFKVSAEDPKTKVSWPGMLWLAGHDDEVLDLVALLWRRAIRRPGLFRFAQDAFGVWVGTADGMPEQVAALGRLLERAIESDYDATRFAQSIESYEDENDETDATRSLLALIDGVDLNENTET